MKWLILVIMLSVEVVIYYQSKSDAKYREQRLFLISIPTYAYESQEVKALCHGFKKENQRNYLIIALLALPIIFLSGIANLVYMMAWFVILVIGSNFALRKYRSLLKELKKEKQWIVKEERKMHVDLKLSAYMENVKTNWYLLVIPLSIDLILFGLGIYYKQMILVATALLMIFILCVGSYFISRMANQAYTNDTDLNISLNLARKKSYFMALFYIGCGDACFNLGLFMLDKQFIFGLLCLGLAVCVMILMVYTLLSFPRLKARMIRLHEDKFYYQNLDEVWRVGILGAVYDNPSDPRTLVPSPNGMQMIFNAAKPGYRYFILIIVGVIILFLGYIFGYPYYLDQRHELAELTLTKTTLCIDSPFYKREWALESIDKVEWSENLGKGVRVNGTDTGVYGKGHYRFDRYGDCEVYLASLHPAYIILYTQEGVFIVNDDEQEQTKAVYKQLVKKVE